MLITVSPKQAGNSLYGDVGCAPAGQDLQPRWEEWQGWQEYEKALTEHNKSRLMALIDQHFFACESDHPTMEDKLAEALLYPHPLRQGSGAALKVKQDLKRKLAREIELDEGLVRRRIPRRPAPLMLKRAPRRHGRRPATG